jgi:hypothetical protein
MDVRRQADLQQAVPHAFGPVRIVIARNEVPLDVRIQAHALDRRAQRDRARHVAVIDIACHQHVARAMRPGARAKALDGGIAGQAERLFLGAELPEYLADLPVGGVNESHLGHCLA